MEKLFNDGWEFQLEGDAVWRSVELPHDWLISDTKNLYKTSVGKYRKTLDCTGGLPDAHVWLRFDGVYQDSALYVNGALVGEWKHGYTVFSHEITPFLHDGANEILLTVNYQSPNSRWYSGAGVYRDCWLVTKGAAYFMQDGVYAAAAKVNGVWQVNVDAEVCLLASAEVDDELSVEVRHQIEGMSLLEDDSEAHVEVAPECFVVSSLLKCADAPNLWDINHPRCYTLVSELCVDGVIVDTARTRIGFRAFSVSPDDGFVLNGRRVELFGVCQHHDLGGLGAAVSKDALRRQLDILRDMGVNAIRTAHNPPAAVFMELADEMGFLVQSEITDMWRRSKTTYDYARFFDDWAVRDVAAWVRRDRNCPSLVMWSVGNEIYDTHASFEDGSATMQFLMNEVAKHDPRRNALPTLCSNYMPWENTQKCADIIKLIGYNYAEYLYHDHHAKHPDWIIYGGETASTVQSRGIYHFPLAKSILSDDDLQCSSLGNSTTSWGAKRPEACIIDHRNAPFALGQFIWTGFDYIGEPTPYHTKNSYFGQIDTAGFPKDSFYIYQAGWVKFEDRPTLHLFPHWDWNPGQPIDVRIASNAPSVELFVNGVSQGKRTPDLTTDYHVPYVPGEIKAVAYDHDGNIVMETTRRSFGDAVEVYGKRTHYGELTFVEIYAVDADDHPVENANNRVIVRVEGGTLLALDNGDSSDYDLYQPAQGVNMHSRRMFSGKLLAIIKRHSDAEPVIHFEIDSTDIPVRKIELMQSEDFVITAKIHPADATCTDALSWRITDAGGIDSPLAAWIGDNTGVSVQFAPKGDGELFVRCSVTNGKPHADLISLLPITLAGYGKPFLNPYEFLSGGLHNRSNALMGNGNDRGVATLRDGDSHVGFADVDFGAYGSDTVTFWLFPLDGSPFDFEIFDGMPKDGGTHLYTAHYDKGSQWNTYKEVTYTLPQKLTGVRTLCLIFRRKVHIKGFLFAAPQRAFAQICFAQNDGIYGDSFEVKTDSVEKIGNNVTITFTGLDFGADEARRITLAWRSNRGNDIRMVFSPDDGTDVVNLLTVPAQADYAPATLSLETPLRGRGTLIFIFLPGTEIDLASFHLEA
ncbi:MAG: DUF4982 domain-containing protein [Defluviitaleaceae bacterium]|nr:DUF4982 domain-containing protein [Defluviitaleaceae bacterium]